MLSATVVAEVVVTAKMGLKPDASRGLVLLTDSELLDGAVVPVIVFKEVVAMLVLWLGSPNRPDPITEVVLLLEVLETWPNT